MKQQVVILSALIGAAAVAGALAVRNVLPFGADEKKGPRTPVIVELFTSEG